MAITMKTSFNSQEILFAINLKYLTFVGLWPKSEWSEKSLLYYRIYEITLHILSIIFLIITGIGTFQHRNEITLFLSNLDKSIVVYNFVLKVVVFVKNRKQLKILIDEILRSGDYISEERRKLMFNHVVFITVVGTGLVLVFSGLAQYKFEMTVEAWMPFDPMKNRMNLLLAAQVLAVTFTSVLYRSFAMQGIVCSMMMYVCDQLIELQTRLTALEYSPENEGAMRDELKQIVKKHIRIIGYSNSMTMIFKEFFLIQNLAISAELCMNAMMVNMVGLNDKNLLISFVAFLGFALLNAYIYCYLGNDMIVESGRVALAAYETGWTSWPVDLQKDLLLIIKTAQKPLTLSAGGIATMSLKTYSQALYNGFSVFAVLNDLVD